MLTDISLNSRDVPIIAVESPNPREISALSKEQISAGVVEALELQHGHLHKPKAKTSVHQDEHKLCGRSPANVDNFIQFIGKKMYRQTHL